MLFASTAVGQTAARFDNLSPLLRPVTSEMEKGYSELSLLWLWDVFEVMGTYFSFTHKRKEIVICKVEMNFICSARNFDSEKNVICKFELTLH